ncbi:MAG: DUF2065 domain-containing protein [Pseudomonadota bacterium]
MPGFSPGRSFIGGPKPMWTLLLAALGLWFLIEGLIYAGAPSQMRRFGAWLTTLPDDVLRQAGLFSMAIGALFLVIALRVLK